MPTPTIVPSLALFTLIAVLAIAVIAYFLFIRKRSNRHPVEKPHLAGRSMAPKKDDAST